MKTEIQILRYVSQCSFPENDWRQVLDYCRVHFGGGKAHKSLHPLSESTYQQFLGWLDDGVGVGDIVKYGQTVGIVGGCSPKAAYLSAYISFDGSLIVDRMDVDVSRLAKAEPKDVERFNELLTANGLRFVPKSSALTKAFIPSDGDFVRVSSKKRIMPAIFKSNDGEKCCFYMVANGAKLGIDVSFSNDDVDVLSATKTSNLRLLDALKANSLEWSAKDMRLRKMSDKRAKKRGRYYYITDTLDIESDADTYAKVHDRRFRNGNYFPNFQEAFRVRERVVEAIKKAAEERKS